MFQRALRIREQALGQDHPLLVAPLTNLARISYEQGKDQQAEALYQRALHIRERALGMEHPQVGTTLHELAALYLKQRRDEEAERLYRDDS